jgi:hypothetical protein
MVSFSLLFATVSLSVGMLRCALYSDHGWETIFFGFGFFFDTNFLVIWACITCYRWITASGYKRMAMG